MKYSLVPSALLVNCQTQHQRERNLEQRQLKLTHAWELQTVTGKGRLLTDSTYTNYGQYS